MRTPAWLDTLLGDVRYALRGLRRAPVFALTIILTLGLGIGANTAMFGIVDRLMFRPFPYMREPDAVNRVYLRSTYRGQVYTGPVSEYTRYLDMQRFTHSFSQTAGFTNTTLAVGSGADSRERRVGVVSASFFDFFDAKPALGRYFIAAEDTTPRGADVAVLDYEFWQTEFGGRADVIGQTLQVRNLLCTIIGVAPKGFVGIWDGTPPDVYIPITTFAGSAPGAQDRATYYTRYNWGWMDMIARRKPGVTVEAASADLTQAHVKSWEVMLSQDPATPVAEAHPLGIAGPIKAAAGPDPTVEAKTVRWVSGIALIVLLIACSNVANLFLSRALRRRRETAVRIALGVARRRLMAQWFTESLLLALIGCAAGVLIAQWGGAALRHLFVGDGAAIPVASDWRTLGVSAALAVVAAILTGFAPMLVRGREGIAADLKAGSREGTHHRSRLRTGLLVAQVTMSAVLLVGAGLFVRSFANVRSMRIGFDADRTVLMSRNLRGAAFPDSQLIALDARLLAAAQALPGVEHAATASSVPFWSTSSTRLIVPGIDSTSRLGQFTYQTATPDYFAAMGTHILRGRAFDDRDRAGTPRVAVVSDAMAKVLWPGEEAIGKVMRVGSDTAAYTTVIGIAEDAAQNDLQGNDRFRYYMPLDQFRPVRGSYVIVRVSGDPAAAAETIRKALQPLMPGDTYVTARPLQQLVDGRQRAWRFGATMFVAFGFLALVVAAIGLYGVIGYNVAQRMHELGVRVALGAQRAHLIRLVMRQGIGVSVVGIAAGTVIAFLLSDQVQPLLFQEQARDPVVFGIVAVTLLAVAVVASAAPARRASRADPNTALRSD